MNTKKYLLTILGTTFFSLILSANPIVNAEDQSQESLEGCIKRYTELIGASSSDAFSECKREALKKCVEKLQKEKKVLTSIRQEGKEGKNRFLIDLGDNQSDWWEGQIWTQNECQANTTGQYHRSSRESDRWFGPTNYYEWFRQGWCSKPELVLEESYTFEEAKNRCEVDPTGQTKMNKQNKILRVQSEKN